MAILRPPVLGCQPPNGVRAGTLAGRQKGQPKFRTLFANLPDDEDGRRELVGENPAAINNCGKGSPARWSKRVRDTFPVLRPPKGQRVHSEGFVP